jgi:hypothetical protein
MNAEDLLHSATSELSNARERSSILHLHLASQETLSGGTEGHRLDALRRDESFCRASVQSHTRLTLAEGSLQTPYLYMP